MPAEFWRYNKKWVLGEREWKRDKVLKKYDDSLDRSEEVLLYEHMTSTWSKAFTPGVVLAFVGFVVMLLRLAYVGGFCLSRHLEGVLILLGPLLAIVYVVYAYQQDRPELGTD